MPPNRSSIEKPRMFHLDIAAKLIVNGVVVATLIGYSLYKQTWLREEPDLKQKAEELNNISASLRTLSDYVSDQKSKLDETAKTLSELETKKLITEKALSINDEQLKSLAQVMNGSETSKWIDRLLGFFLGTLSSIIASYVWEKKVKPRC